MKPFRKITTIVIHKWLKHGSPSEQDCPKCSAMTPLRSHTIPKKAFKELQAWIASVKISFYDSTIRNWAKWPTWQGLKAHLSLATNILMIPKTFEKILCGLTRLKFNWRINNIVFQKKYEANLKIGWLQYCCQEECCVVELLW